MYQLTKTYKSLALSFYKRFNAIRLSISELSNLEQKIVAYICAGSFIGFTSGLAFDLAGFLVDKKILLAGLNLFTLLPILVGGWRCVLRRISPRRFLLFILGLMQVNVVISMVARLFQVCIHTEFQVATDMIVGLLNCILAACTQNRRVVGWFSFSNMAVYCTVAALLRSWEMAALIPSLGMIFVMAPISISLIREALLKTSAQKQELEKVQKGLCDSLIQMARTRRLNLSTRELEVVTLMLAGKNLEQISETLQIKIATTRCHRFNIRAKLGLEKKENLMIYLRSLLMEEAEAKEKE